MVEEGPRCYRFACNTCPYVQNIERTVGINFISGATDFTCPLLHQLVSYKFPALKKVDDVLGGQEAWKNVDSTEGTTEYTHAKFMFNSSPETCPKCSHPRAYFLQIQTRSADEPMTIFYKCCGPECGHQWKE